MSGVLPPLVEPGGELDDEAIERYARQLTLPGFGADAQRRLRNARVLVIGAGGLGAPALLGLASAGVGVLGIVDADRVELGNLQRQFAHRLRDVGRRKTRSASRAIRALNPGVSVREHPVRLTAANASGIFAEYDLVVDGSDNFATRHLIADTAEQLGLPSVWGSVLRFEGQLSVFWGARGVRYRDLYPDAPTDGPSCGTAGVFGPLCAIIGAQLAAEAIKLITGTGRVLLGRVAVFDALHGEWRGFALEGERGAAAGARSIGIVTASALRQELAGADGGPILVDVRESGEPGGIAGAVRAPLSALQAGSVPALDGELVVYCARGIRSGPAAEFLRRAGHGPVRTLAGGLAAWEASAR
ncbi:ThiF family adenylyltransferase [Agromyces sp. ISL-38]|uniref:ThiF family adenylyltransferase n=1 Tax=Agromyces sp. ISL-38 TaxID=2819107 RepID=UPI001BEC5D59|nr:ThiF family adenylyltransferase [Agromyces sp. ISL-38]MBT2500389.1 ThiF family adenylyltransferase [Agromyces sp. ISL-38]